MPQTSLPIDGQLPAIVDALTKHANAVVQAPPGAGKTTRVPIAILQSGLNLRGQIIVLEPRRIAARAAARRMAEEQGFKLGQEVGYQVRFDRCASAKTRV